MSKKSKLISLVVLFALTVSTTAFALTRPGSKPQANTPAPHQHEEKHEEEVAAATTETVPENPAPAPTPQPTAAPKPTPKPQTPTPAPVPQPRRNGQLIFSKTTFEGYAGDIIRNAFTARTDDGKPIRQIGNIGPIPISVLYFSRDNGSQVEWTDNALSIHESVAPGNYKIELMTTGPGINPPVYRGTITVTVLPDPVDPEE